MKTDTSVHSAAGVYRTDDFASSLRFKIKKSYVLIK